MLFTFLVAILICPKPHSTSGIARTYFHVLPPRPKTQDLPSPPCVSLPPTTRPRARLGINPSLSDYDALLLERAEARDHGSHPSQADIKTSGPAPQLGDIQVYWPRSTAPKPRIPGIRLQEGIPLPNTAPQQCTAQHPATLWIRTVSR